MNVSYYKGKIKHVINVRRKRKNRTECLWFRGRETIDTQTLVLVFFLSFLRLLSNSFLSRKRNHRIQTYNLVYIFILCIKRQKKYFIKIVNACFDERFLFFTSYLCCWNRFVVVVVVVVVVMMMMMMILILFDDVFV
jgi:hypothetical protein